MRTVAGAPVRGPAESGAASWQGSVKDKDLTAPPGSPTLGDRYIVASPATGDWSGKEDQIAEWDGDEWICNMPAGGWIVYVDDEGEIYAWNGSSWGMESFGPHAATHKGGGSDEIDAATGSVAGLMASADKVKLDASEKYVHRGDPATADFTRLDFIRDDGWHDLDLSAILPAAASGKLILFRVEIQSSNLAHLFTLRQPGQLSAHNAGKISCPVINRSFYASLPVLCDINRQIEYKTSPISAVIDLTVAGWWE